VVSDHVASCTSRGHTTDAVPFVVSVAADRDKTRGLKRAYHERDARELGIFIPEGYRLLERLLRE
jgi:2,3-bisphosphoglycerate-independent phosphoglycerate mutase